MPTMNLAEIGPLVQRRRQALGLSQARLAKLAGLSRATVNQLETGTLVDLGAAKLFGLLDLLGIRLDASEPSHRRNALELTSRTTSVGYKQALSPEVLASALVRGDLPAEIVPHIATLLDEAPLALIVGTVEEVAATRQFPPKRVWKHLAQWAHDLKSTRAAWT